ncbi:hypothetical protein [Cobetia crustatorum]|uniref:hypothetical protein n=1 Tax=Cobetia crustatorum TaxID=553385 RepID=UPI0004BA576B|nr:hypothetical protein [Cobetia crustatorum]
MDDEPAYYAIAQHASKIPASRIDIVNLRLTDTPRNGCITNAHTLFSASRTITR